MHTSLTPPNFVIPLNKQIYCFKISPYEASSNLFVAALVNKIVIGLLHFPEDNNNEEFTWERLRELDQDTRSHAIAFSPETSLSMLPKPTIKFCTAGADFIVRIFRSNLDDNDTVQEVNRHTSYVNDVAWDLSGKYLASVSDDHSCQIRSQNDDFKSEIIFRLKSPGITVCFHPENPDKVLVAEKRGTIVIFNIENQNAVNSIETNKSPLMGADWNLRNQFLVTSIAAGEASVFDLRCPYRAMETKTLHEDGGLTIKYSPNAQQVVASVGRPAVTLVVAHIKSEKTELPILVASLKLYGGLSWHSRLPYICCADDSKLSIWKVYVK
ncbi:nucleoporin Nup37 [Contarinia nasturtii]|uniref:nucleoporin Nup37 n=1 Tax=Contarinia nasturtii TaxID=265458 RepID=UPI0012D3A723|nr:nucleoporin Nup37 [Contarinia nasturtii]